MKPEKSCLEVTFNLAHMFPYSEYRKNKGKEPTKEAVEAIIGLILGSCEEQDFLEALDSVFETTGYRITIDYDYWDDLGEGSAWQVNGTAGDGEFPEFFDYLFCCYISSIYDSLIIPIAK